MRLTRYLRPLQVKLELDTRTPDSVPEGWSRERFVWSIKARVLAELVSLLDASGRVVNPTKLGVDLENRERKASTAIGSGIAVPHVRTMQARDFTICFARSTPGVEFDAPDGAPVHFLLGVVAPPYNDRLYLEVYRRVALVLGRAQAREAILQAGDVHEIVKVVADFDV